MLGEHNVNYTFLKRRDVSAKPHRKQGKGEMSVRLSALRADSALPSRNIPVNISVRG
jgi:hypothetical protein